MMKQQERLRLNDRILILTLFVQLLILVNQVFTLGIYAGQSFQSSMIPTPGGETLKVHLSTDTGRPKGILDRITRYLRGQPEITSSWLGAWLVGGVERTEATVAISITVTGSNVLSTATVDYWIEGRPSGGGEPFRFLEATGQSVTVGGSALQDSDNRGITAHLEAMSLATDQSWTIDYYVYVKALATGSVSGETLTSEITETKFTTKTYTYVEVVQYSRAVTASANDGYVRYGSIDYTNTILNFGDYSSSGYDYRPWVLLTLFQVPQGTVLTAAELQFKVKTAATVFPTMTITAEDVDGDASTRPTSYSNYNSRPRTEASVEWTPTTWGPAGQWVSSPDIAPVIQEVLDREGWVQGNSIQMFVQEPNGWGGVTNQLQTYSYDYAAGYAPKLVVSYISYGASWYPLAPMSLASLPITLDVVAWSALIAATALVWRENRRKMK